MSFISAIRQRSGLVVGVVAVSLVVFIITSIVSDPTFTLFNPAQTVGEINGETIPAKDFALEIDRLEAEFQVQNNRGPNEQERQQIRDQAWNTFIFQKIYKPEAEKLGLKVTEEETIDMVQGENVHPAIRQAFTNPQTQQFDKNQVINFLKNIDKVEPQQRMAWQLFESKLPDDRLRSKYEALLTKTEYVTRAQAAFEYVVSQEKATVQYLFVNYASIVDSTIKVTDEELSAYLKENQYRYKAQDNRAIDYVQFMLTPSGEDSAAVRQELDRLKAEFLTVTDDTTYATANSDAPAKLQTVGVNELPAELSPIASSLVTGQVYGPYLAGTNYTLYKVISVGAEGAFNAKASHILFKADKGGSDSAKQAAKKQAQDILAKIKGGANFEEMARMYGSDGTKDQGGDLGWFDETRMVKPFADAVFAYNGTGLLQNLVETDFGYHIVKVTAPKTNVKYKVVAIQKGITAGDKTTEALYAKATLFKQAAQDLATFEGTLKIQGLTKQTAPNLFKTGNGFNDVTEGRQVMVWAYNDETKINDVSTIFELNDRYVVAILTKKSEEGPAKLEDVRDALTTEVRKAKKAELILTKLGTGTLEEMQKREPTAVVNTTPDVVLSSMAFAEVGYDPEAVGRLFGLKAGQATKPTKGESGVYALKLVSTTPAPALDDKTDLTTYKTQVANRSSGRAQYFVGEALKETTRVKDNRIRIY